LTGIAMQGYLQSLSPLGPAEADNRALEVDVVDPQQPDA
jgi:hypothetical protein